MRLAGLLITLLVAAAAPSQTVTTIAGGGVDDGRPALNADLIDPRSIAIDAEGNIYIADGMDDRIRKISAATGIISTFAGTGVLEFSGDGGPAKAAAFNGPTDIVFDREGNLYIADTSNARVRRIDAHTGIISTFAGNGGFTSDGDGRPPTDASLFPDRLAIDREGNVYVAEFDRIREILNSGVIVTRAGGALFGGGEFRPSSLAFDPAGNLIVGDRATHRIYSVNTERLIVTPIAGTGKRGFSGDLGPATKADITEPVALAFDKAGNLYFSDYGNGRVRMITKSGRIATIAGDGGRWPSGEGGPAVVASIGAPYALAFDASENLYVVDHANDLLLKIDHQTHRMTTIAGKRPRWTGDGGPARAARLAMPMGIAVDAAGHVFIADSEHYQIRRFDPESQTITTIAGDGTQGNSGVGGPAIYAQLNGSRGLALDRDGNLYIADIFGGRVLRLAASTCVLTTIAADRQQPKAVRFDGDGNLYIVDQNRVLKMAAGTHIMSPVAGNGTAGYAGDGGPATAAELNEPEDVAISGDGTLYVADQANGRIRVVDPDTGVISTLAGNQEGIGSLSALALDRSDHLYVAQYGEVLKIDPATHTITRVAGRSTPGAMGDGGPALDASFGAISAIAIDEHGNLYIADWAANRIRVVHGCCR